MLTIFYIYGRLKSDGLDNKIFQFKYLYTLLETSQIFEC